MTDRLGRLLLVTLEAARVDADLPVLGALRSWLDSWRGIGAVERGMAHQGYDLQLTRYDERGWRAGASLMRCLQSPRCCGELDGGVECDRVWMTCSCGAVLVRVVAFG